MVAAFTGLPAQRANHHTTAIVSCQTGWLSNGLLLNGLVSNGLVVRRVNVKRDVPMSPSRDR